MRGKSAYPLLITSIVAFIGFWIAVSVIWYTYFPESSFDLASDSRFPKWISVPPGSTRDSLHVTLSYYIMRWPWAARYTLEDKSKSFEKTVHGDDMCGEAFNLEGKEGDHQFQYPAYEAIRVNGMTEIIEHRKMEPIFYVTDDPAVWTKYLSLGCK